MFPFRASLPDLLRGAGLPGTADAGLADWRGTGLVGTLAAGLAGRRGTGLMGVRAAGLAGRRETGLTPLDAGLAGRRETGLDSRLLERTGSLTEYVRLANGSVNKRKLLSLLREELQDGLLDPMGVEFASEI